MTPETLEARKARTLDSLHHARRMLEAAESPLAKARHSRRICNALDTLLELRHIARERFGVPMHA